jgi:hypothetical protein
MGDFENKLNELLKSPESLEQIMNLARSLSGAETEKEEKQEVKQENFKEASPSSSGLGFDPQIMGLIGAALKEYSSPSENTALISAIKPYLKQDRREKVEKAMQIAKLAKVAKNVLPDIGGPNNV